jgi:hypothetical protein
MLSYVPLFLLLLRINNFHFQWYCSTNISDWDEQSFKCSYIKCSKGPHWPFQYCFQFMWTQFRFDYIVLLRLFKTRMQHLVTPQLQVLCQSGILKIMVGEKGNGKLHQFFKFSHLTYQKIPICFFQVKNCFSNILNTCAGLLGNKLDMQKKLLIRTQNLFLRLNYVMI